ncbi:type II toxin-antitoxin system RelE/ParE family toxin [Wolbachia endosymbiont of Cantharis cryptica]|uniref:type II toxin-antitoxin system RelE family toxin n=1 Tax=Wolbachia endosymbiont of Cantharis cryptica TaxID=3066132 RepID=UPI00376EBC70
MKISNGDKVYEIEFLKKCAKKDFPALPKKTRENFENAIEKELKVDPIRAGKPLCGKLLGYRRLDSGGYRLIYRVNIAKYKVFIVAAGPRGDIYKRAGLPDLLSNL